MAKAPEQPTTQVRQPPSDQTKTIRTNDPVTDAAEEQRANAEQEDQDAHDAEVRKQQEEAAAQQQKEFEQRTELMKSIVASNEGFVEVTDDNRDAIELARRDGYVYFSNVQSGPGGINVQERAFLSDKGFADMRTHFGPNMGK